MSVCSGQNRRLKMRLPMLRSIRRPSLGKENFEGVVVDHLQVSPIPGLISSGDQLINQTAFICTALNHNQSVKVWLYNRNQVILQSSRGRQWAGKTTLEGRKPGADPNCRGQRSSDHRPWGRKEFAAHLNTTNCTVAGCLAADCLECIRGQRSDNPSLHQCFFYHSVDISGRSQTNSPCVSPPARRRRRGRPPQGVPHPIQ